MAQFSSYSDPELGPPPNQLTVGKLFLATYLIALVVGLSVAENPKSNFWALAVQVYAVFGALAFTVGQTNDLKRSVLRFFVLLIGCGMYAYFLRYVVIFLAKRNEDLGMASALPLALTLGALVPTILGAWMSFAALQYGKTKKNMQQDRRRSDVTEGVDCQRRRNTG